MAATFTFTSQKTGAAATLSATVSNVVSALFDFNNKVVQLFQSSGPIPVQVDLNANTGCTVTCVSTSNTYTFTFV